LETREVNFPRSVLTKEGFVMRRSFSIAILFLVFSFFTLPVVAQTEDGVTPAVEGVCNGLKAPGVSKGLYGLCIAYCEAEASSESVLRNYNRRRSSTDPEMPCLEVVVACPCWDTDALAAAEQPFSCVANPGGDNGSQYFDGSLFFIAPGESGAHGCVSFVGGVFSEVTELTDEQTESCLGSLAASQAIDFPDGCN